jgi:hypothetical protein
MLAVGHRATWHSKAEALAAGANLVTLSVGGDAFSWPGAKMSNVLHTNVVTLASGSGTFGPCDAGMTSTAPAYCTNAAKDICVTGADDLGTIGAQAPATTLCGSLSSISTTSSLIATMSMSATLPTPAYGNTGYNVNAAGTGYLVGDTITLSFPGISPIGTFASAVLVQEITAVSAIVSGAGSGGPTTGTCGVVGTTGRINAMTNTPSNGYYRATVPMSGGSITGTVATITYGGDYIGNPHSPDMVVPDSNSATPCTGLTGATLIPAFGIKAVAPNRYGLYPNIIVGTTVGSQASTTGSGTLATVSLSQPSIAVSGVVTWGTDISQAYSDAVNAVNSGRKAGLNTLLYLPPGQCASISNSTTCVPSTTGSSANGSFATGAYYFGPATGSPPFTNGGGIVTDGDYAVTLYMSPQYGVSNPYGPALPNYPLVWWSTTGLDDGTFDAPTSAFSNQFGPSLTGGLTIIGDRTANPDQIGMAFCGNNYFAEIHDYQFRHLPGTGLQYGCMTTDQNETHNRESRFYNIRGFLSGASPSSATGSANLAAIDINTQQTGTVSASMDDVGFDNVELFGNHGIGIIIHAAHTNGSIGYVNFTGRLRVEGLAPDGTPLVGPLIQIGDTSSAMDGPINDVSFPVGMQLVDPYLGSPAFEVTSSTSTSTITGLYATNPPFDITTAPGTSISGGGPYGNGLDIDACNNCDLSVEYINVFGTAYSQGPSPSRTSKIMLHLQPGATKNWVTNIDPAAVITQPAAFAATGPNAILPPGTVFPIPAPPAGVLPISPSSGTFSAVTTDAQVGTYYQIGTLTCIDFVATLNLSSTTAGGPAGSLQFYLPVLPAFGSHDGIAVTNLSLSSGTLAWPESVGVTTTQILFAPVSNHDYGLITFQGSHVALQPYLSVSNLVSNTTYTFNINGCYQ